MLFYICHCGNTEDNHNFRHPYQNVAKVTYDIDDDCNEYFILNAHDFPLKSDTRCSKPNCSSSICIHGTDIIQHEYEPEKYFYRHIKLSVPKEAQCIQTKCKQLKDHQDITTHNFTTKVVIENLAESDIVEIIDPENEDNKIIWR